MTTRAQEFQDVRRLLGLPLPQQPSPDLIVAQLLRQEQLMLNKLNGSGKGWSVATTTVTTVDGTASYALAPASGAMHGIGKPLFVYRDIGNGDIMPVPLTDFSHELHNQTHEFWWLPEGSSETDRYRSEKVAFYRTADTAGVATQMMRVYPTPEEDDIVYTIAYAAGALNPAEIALTDTPVMPEWSNLRTLESALYLLPYTAWEGHTMNDNLARRKEVMASLAAQVGDHREEFSGYLANPQHEPVGDVGYWWE
jgi:hypothetical protein